MDQSAAELVFLLVLSNVAGIIAKIIWDWLKGRGKVDDQNGNVCLHHQATVETQKCLDQCVRGLITTTTRLETVLNAHTEQIKKELADGQTKFTRLETRIGDMRESLAGELGKICAEVKQLQRNMNATG